MAKLDSRTSKIFIKNVYIKFKYLVLIVKIINQNTFLDSTNGRTFFVFHLFFLTLQNSMHSILVPWILKPKKLWKTFIFCFLCIIVWIHCGLFISLETFLWTKKQLTAVKIGALSCQCVHVERIKRTKNRLTFSSIFVLTRYTIFSSSIFMKF